MWSLIFVAIGGANFLGVALQFSMLGISGARLTRKLRSLSFRALLRQEMGFFDKSENSVGQLTTRLSTEATLVQGVTGDLLGSIVQMISAVVTGFVIAFLHCWRIALVLLAVFPLMGLSEAMQMKMLTGFDANDEKMYAKAGAIAAEAVDNIETVTTLCVQDNFLERYSEALESPLQLGRKKAFYSGLMFGIAEFTQQALWAIAFWVGSVFMDKQWCTFSDLLQGITGLLFAGSALGQASSFMPDVGKSKVAATNIFRLLDRRTEIDPTDDSGVAPLSKVIHGDIATNEVKFEYPTRPSIRVLDGLSLKVDHGQTLALVGESGCGKSTVLALLERFYDARQGTVALDNRNNREYAVGNLREHFGMVTQEPDLFDRTVWENIAYGLSHAAGTPVTDDMVVAAAKEANADEFICRMNEGYNTKVGPRGAHLSGGQRQRVAIARALIRQPRVLLLDECSSALDAASERLVQQALQHAARSRTTITVAHRLSSIKDADIIAVVSEGRIVECGNHEDLLSRGGTYARLVQNQIRSV